MTDRFTSHPLVELTLVRLREFVREPEAVFWVFVFPIVLAGALGIAFRTQGDEPVHAGVVAGPGSEAVVAALDGVARNRRVRIADARACRPRAARRRRCRWS